MVSALNKLKELSFVRFPYIFGIIFISLIIQCTKVDTIADLEPRAVVEAYLGAGDSISIQVFQEIPFGSTDTLGVPITGLNIKITVNNNSFQLHDADSGVYTSPTIILENQTYTLEFTYKDKKVTAFTTIPEYPKGFQISVHEITRAPLGPGSFGGGGFGLPEPVDLTWTNPDQSFYLSAYRNIELAPEAINGGIIQFGRRFRLRFNEPTQGTSAQIQPFQFEYYGRHDILLMHVLPEYAALYENTGNSSLNLDPPQTNITNGLGIFTGFAADTMELLVKKP
ncbi:MAG: DUF4249 family protein [Saprospiraceae bacterium]